MVKKEQIFGLLTCLLALFGCKPESCDIKALCVRDEIGNYIIKWETNPVIQGTAKLYVSDVPDKFDMSHPAITTPIEDGFIRYITENNIQRKYFRITFNDHFPQDIAAQYTFMEGIQNFRDVGGYKSKKGRHIRWGKIYRSGNIHNFTSQDSIRMSAAGIKTIIDLRTAHEVKEKPIYFPNTQIIHIPIPCGNKDEMMQRILENKVRKRDGSLFMEDAYIRFIANNTEDFGEALRILLDKKNYPVLISGELGKDRVGMFISFLFSILDIPQESITREYMASNQYINPGFMAKTASSLSSDSQETMTVLLSVSESYLNIAYQEIENRYGSFDNYRETGLKISGKNKDKLKDLLLK